MSELIKTLALLATTVGGLGVLFAGWQLWQTKRQAVTSFEDQVAKEYRELIREIPVSALLGKEVSEEKYNEVREYIYNYIDLSNEQVFLRQVGRVTKSTWEYWQDGIKSNLSRPIFNRVWVEVKESVQESFQELRSLEQHNFDCDPKHDMD
ncbi:hypothetical protein ACFL1N_09540 [Thermodesulfobacteriota bacterium]